MNVDIKELVERSVNKLRENYVLPEEGILTGGSLANTMFGLLTNTKTTFDDIDIFILQKPQAEYQSDKFTLTSGTIITQQQKAEYPTVIMDDYTMSVKNSTTEGIINKIYYTANKVDKIQFLKGFDINCTKVSYDLETGKSYWTEDFEDFLINKKVSITNLCTPQHSVIRYLKKCKDLNLRPDKNELDMVYIYMLNSTSFMIRSFGDKVYNKYKQNSNILKRYFLIKETTMNSGKTHYDFVLNEYPPIDYEKKTRPKGFEFKPSNFTKFYKDILGDSYMEMLYKKLNIFIDQDINYVDTRDAMPYQIEMISKLISNSLICYNISKLKLSDQIKLVESLFDQFYDNQIIAYSILNKVPFTRSDFTEKELLALSFTTIRNRQNKGVKDRYYKFKRDLNENKKQKSYV